MYWSLEAETLITKERLHQRKKKKRKMASFEKPCARKRKEVWICLLLLFVRACSYVCVSVCLYV